MDTYKELSRNYLSSVEWQFESYFTRNSIWLEITKSWTLPAIASIIYLSFVFLAKRYMENKKRFELRTPMLAWSILLAIFSIVGTIRMGSRIFGAMIIPGNLSSVICYSGEFFNYPVIQFWSLIFAYSKFVEYIDTVFIILRKQNLPFLHWYHHFTVAIFSWNCFSGQQAGGMVFCAMNYLVHAIMYSYYSLRAARIKPPKCIAIFITTLQIVQMIAGCIVVGALVILRNKNNCRISGWHLISGILMYSSYLLLFINFFYKTYINPSKKVEKTKSGESGMNKCDQQHNSLKKLN